MSESDGYDELMAVFLAECDECLVALEGGLVQLETSPDDAEAINTVFRAAHTLKGTSATVGFLSLVPLAHSMENVLDGIREGRLTASSAVISLLLRSGDAFRGMLKDVSAESDEVTPEVSRLMAALDSAGGSSEETQPPGPRQLEMVTEEREKSAPANEAPPAKGRRIRVGLDKLDALLDLTGEIVISLGRARAGVEALEPGEREYVLECLSDTDTLLSDLREQVMSVRMLPIGGAFEPHRRTVRDIAQQTGKEVRLEIAGSDVEIDASIIEHIKDPLTQMIRNAVGHGIENPEQRRRAGKPEEGVVTLRAFRESSYIVIEVEDDGAGLDRDRILLRARERGLIDQNQEMSDSEIDRLIFAPGFSTADELSDLSGRGVGMDIVSRNVGALRGQIEIVNERNAGTTFIMRFPLTLAILPGLAVEVDGERFIIPLDVIEECLEIPSVSASDQSSGILDVHGTPLPYLRLSSYYGLRRAPSERECLVVVRAGRRRAGLVADRLLGEIQTVVKPIGQLLQQVPGLAGSTLFGDGRVGLILDIPILLEQILRGRKIGRPHPSDQDRALQLRAPQADMRHALTINPVSIEETKGTGK